MTDKCKYAFRLFVAGLCPEDQEKIFRVKKILKKEFGKAFSLEVVDVIDNPEVAVNERIIATPTMIRENPAPAKKTIISLDGDDQQVSSKIGDLKKTDIPVGAKRILVIDDDASIRKSFSLALEDTGYAIDEAGSGEAGIDMEKKEGYDMIFLDLKMPGIDGVETLRQLRKSATNMPVYIITAYHRDFLSQLKSLREEGIYFELLQSPMEREEIIEIANAVLK